MQKITQEILDNSMPVKPSYFGLRKFGSYLIMFVIIEIVAMSFCYFLNYFVGIHSPVTIENFVITTFLAAVASLVFLSENVLIIPKFVLKTLKLEFYAESLNSYYKLEEEYDKQQNYFRLHEVYKDIL